MMTKEERNQRFQESMRRRDIRGAMVTAALEGKDLEGLSPSQGSTLQRFLDRILESHCEPNLEDHEFKSLEIKFLSNDLPTLVVLCETGLKNDERTMASVFCRNRVQAFIGRKGGISSYISGKRKNSHLTVRGLHAVVWSDVNSRSNRNNWRKD